MCLCRFIDSNKGALLVGDADNGGDSACEGVGNYGKCLYLPLNLLCT